MAQFTTSDDLTLHYQTAGAKHSGPAVVFLNGMTQTTRHWATHTRDLRDERRVITYDARGQGQSDNPRQVPTLDDHIDDLLGLLDETDATDVDLVGFSHGARIALGAAARGDERLRRLVVCSATAAPTARARTIVRAWREVLERGGLEAMAWASLPDIVGETFLDGHEALLDNIIQASVDRNTEEGTALLLKGLEQFPPLDDLAGRIDIPTLVISGAEDPLVSEDGARQLAELCGGTHRRVDDCGHTVPIEKHDEFQDIIGEFLL